MALARDKRAVSDGLGGARFNAPVKAAPTSAPKGAPARPAADRIVYVPPPAGATQAQLAASVQALASAVGVKPDRLALPCLTAWRKGERLFVWRDESSRHGVCWQACEGRAPEAPEAPAAPAAPVTIPSGNLAPRTRTPRVPVRERSNFELLELFRSRHAMGDDRSLVVCAECEQVLHERGYAIVLRKGAHTLRKLA